MCSEVLPVIFLYPATAVLVLPPFLWLRCQKRWLYDLTFGKTIEISGSLCSMVTTWIIGGLMLITQTFFPLSATGGLLAEAVWRLVGERKKMFIHQDNHQISPLSPFLTNASEASLYYRWRFTINFELLRSSLAEMHTWQIDKNSERFADYPSNELDLLLAPLVMLFFLMTVVTQLEIALDN